MAPPAATSPALGSTKSGLGELDMSKVKITLNQNPRDVPPASEWMTADDTVCTDHMATAVWTADKGWAAPEIKPFGPFTLSPTASVLHYATECFEGMKAYRGFDGRLRLFRPALNAERMRMSSTRCSMPDFDPAAFEAMVMQLLAIDGKKWLPTPGDFLYLRPTMIGTHSQLGVQAPKEAMLYVIATFMAPLDAPAGGMKLRTNPNDTIRAWIGGFGYAKLGANYGPSLLLTNQARAEGFHQILWLYGPDNQCTEAGASNFFVVIKTPEGKTQLITAPLDSKLILAGVTRRSVLELVRETMPDIEVVERTYTIDEVITASKEGRLLETFASGTAYFICPVSQIKHCDTVVDISMGAEGTGGELTLAVKKHIYDIMYGKTHHPWGVTIEEQ